MKAKIFFGTAILICLASCSERSSASSATVWKSGDSIVVRGAIDSTLVDEASRVLRSSTKIHNLEITSSGGNALDGLRLGELVKTHRLNVTVAGVCASACAQYVFVAGLRKTVRPGSLVIFHSSPVSTEALLKRSKLKSAARLFSNAAEQERRFYLSLGLDPALGLATAAYMQPQCVAQRPDRDPNSEWAYGVAWTYSAVIVSRERLAQMGVKDISGSWPSSNGLEADLRALNFRQNFHPIEYSSKTPTLEIPSIIRVCDTADLSLGQS